MSKDDIVKIFTDGGCWNNPGPGGWGVVLKYKGKEKTLSGCEPYTTNNRMELTAAIQALSALNRDCKVTIVTDSKYLRDGITEWIKNWKRNEWKTKNKSMVKNVDLWKRLDIFINKHEVDWEWVKGHSGHRENELADQLADKAIKNFMKSLGIYQPQLF